MTRGPGGAELLRFRWTINKASTQYAILIAQLIQGLRFGGSTHANASGFPSLNPDAINDLICRPLEFFKRSKRDMQT